MAAKKANSIEGTKVFVVHVNVGNMEEKDVQTYMEKKIKPSFVKLEALDDVLVFYMPNRGQGHGVELIYQ